MFGKQMESIFLYKARNTLIFELYPTLKKSCHLVRSFDCK